MLLAHTKTQAQEDQGVQITAGVELRALLSPQLFNADRVDVGDADGNFRATYGYEGGMGFGGVVRVRFTQLWNVETGLYFTRRRYDFNIRDLQTDFTGNTEFRIVSYEIPVKGLVYIRMAEKVYMNVALGMAANFFASDVISIEQEFNVQAFKLSWVRASVLGNMGAEYRTDVHGYFYFGFTVNQTLNDIMITQANYFRDGQNPAFRGSGPVNGAYLSADFRYFFPMARPKQVRYVMPDWRNLGR